MIKRFGLIFGTFIMLTGCATSAPTDEPPTESWDQMTDRISRISAPLLIDNAEYCEVTARQAGVNYCDIPITLIRSNSVNAASYSDEIEVTTGLMEVVRDDLALALIMAHELAHILLKHPDEPTTIDRELEADRGALILLYRAGYDISYVVDIWDRAQIEDNTYIGSDKSSHPSVRKRRENFLTTLDEIIAVLDRGEFPRLDLARKLG